MIVSRVAVLIVAVLAARTTVAAEPLDRVKPQAVGMSAERLARIRPAMQRYVDEGKLAGIITAVARHGKIVHFETYGMADRDANQPMRADSIFRIYSMSKPVTSVAAMMLYEEGKFLLNDPVSNYLPEFEGLAVFDGVEDGEIRTVAAKRPMTVRDLLLHTSGLTAGFMGDGPVERLYRETGVSRRPGQARGVLDLAGLVLELGKLPLRYQPGERFQYGTSTDVLGRLVEVVSGLPFDRFLRERIFTPLGMTDTGFSVPPEKVDRFTANYGPGQDGKIRTIDSPATSRYAGEVTFFSGAGGLVSTTYDYLRFALMLAGGGEFDGRRLLGRKTVDLMMLDHIGGLERNEWFPAGSGFGLGGSVVIDQAATQLPGSLGVWGWGGAASTTFWVDREEELVGVLMTQFMPTFTYPLLPQFQSLTYQALD